MWIDLTQRESTMRSAVVKNMPSSVSLTKSSELYLTAISCLIFAGKMEELTRENAKILQKIVEARQINVKARH